MRTPIGPRIKNTSCMARIRIEDDVVIQENGAPFNLMANIPIEVEEIEALMNA